MPGISAGWDEQNDNLYIVKSTIGWSWREFVEAVDEAYALLGQLDHDVNFAMWFQSLPPGDVSRPMTHAGGTQPANIRHTVIISEVSRFLELVVRKEDRKQGWVGPKIVQSIEEARDYLSTLD